MSAPDGAVRVVTERLGHLGYGPDLPFDFHEALDALAATGWLCDPAEVAALRKVAVAALDVANWHAQADDPYVPEFDALAAALDELDTS